jgi:hypothetical protein
VQSRKAHPAPRSFFVDKIAANVKNVYPADAQNHVQSLKFLLFFILTFNWYFDQKTLSLSVIYCRQI